MTFDFVWGGAKKPITKRDSLLSPTNKSMSTMKILGGIGGIFSPISVKSNHGKHFI
jgi:hypothetical protein